MKETIKFTVIALGIFILLAACKPSDKYVGDWYATSPEGEAKINFSKEKVLTIESDGEKERHEFNQTSSGLINKVRYFGLEMGDGKYYVIFDNTKDEDNAKFIIQTNVAEDYEDVVGDVLFKMNRNDYPN